MVGVAYDGDQILSPEEIMKQADKCLRLLMDVPHEKFTDWEVRFLTDQEHLNTYERPCSYKELGILRDLVGKYVT